jgi:hypothetical protein
VFIEIAGGTPATTPLRTDMTQTPSMTPAQARRASVDRFAAQLGLDPDALARAADAAWSNLNPQSVLFESALSVAGVALQAAAQTDTEGPAAPIDAKDALLKRAESYARDATKFRDDAKLNAALAGNEGGLQWATIYQAVADELRKVAASL